MSAIKSRLRYVVCLCIAIATVIAALHISGYTRIPNALAYSCSTAENPSGHCYEVQRWPNPVTGSATNITVVHLSCVNNCVDGFIDDEMWLQEFNNPNCTTGNCWVEAGYLIGSASLEYFWADSRPNGGFFFHPITSVPGADFGHQTTFIINRTSTTTKWMVDIYDGAGNSWINYSTNNSMAPNQILVGQELAGAGGASAPRADFTHNVYYSGSGSAYQNSVGDGIITINGAPPPYAVMAARPAGNANSGGDIYTYCC